MKGPIDWQLVRMKFESGQSPYAISRDLGGRPTKQGIAKRAAREGWKVTDNSVVNVAAEGAGHRRVKQNRHVGGFAQYKGAAGFLSAQCHADCSHGQNLQKGWQQCRPVPEGSGGERSGSALGGEFGMRVGYGNVTR